VVWQGKVWHGPAWRQGGVLNLPVKQIIMMSRSYSSAVTTERKTYTWTTEPSHWAVRLALAGRGEAWCGELGRGGTGRGLAGCGEQGGCIASL